MDTKKTAAEMSDVELGSSISAIWNRAESERDLGEAVRALFATPQPPQVCEMAEVRAGTFRPAAAAAWWLASVRADIARTAAVVQALKPAAVLVRNGDGEDSVEWQGGTKMEYFYQLGRLARLLCRERELTEEGSE
jgi:anthranilate phosphoribosyltransferase